MLKSTDTTATALARLDGYRLEERCAQDIVAEAIARKVYCRHYDELPRDLRIRVEGSALRAIRAPQSAWMREALTRAHLNLDRAMRDEMGAVYASQKPERRLALSVMAVQAVIAALIGTLEVAEPFEGPGDALRTYDAAIVEIVEAR
jgi:hypothetical protein